MKLNWNGTIELDGKEVTSNIDFSQLSSTSCIVLRTAKKSTLELKNEVSQLINGSVTQYRISVKKYMTKKSTPQFDFMQKWNNDVPMPLMTMVGTVEKELRGMVYMKLHGDTTGMPITVCMKCGKPITNAVSQYFGVGPICGGHNYVNPFETEEELKKAVEDYRRNVLNKITWEGWIIKSAILEKEAV